LKRKRKREELAKEKEELKEAIEEMKRISSEAITEFQNGQQNIERQVTDIGRNIDSLVRLLTTQAQDPTSSFGSLQNYFHL
jgi:predicted  nucleic acid-binding Zn-ribbon protein